MEEYKDELERTIIDLKLNSKDYNNSKLELSIKGKDIRTLIQQYSAIIILVQEESIKIEKTLKGSEIRTTHKWIQKYPYDMTDEFKKAVNNIPSGIDCYTVLSDIFINLINIINGSRHKTTVDIYLVNPKASGGKKAVVKYTVKQLQAIASKNNIKITKKVDGKTVRLNKQGLMTRLKRYKLI
jgi:hypothetical protein